LSIKTKMIFDKKFYLSLEKDVKDILSFSTFLEIDKGKIDSEKLIDIIEKLSDINFLEGVTNLEKTLSLIQKLDLDPDKIGTILKDSNFIQNPEYF